MLYLGVILNIALYHIVHREKLWPSKYIDFCYIATEFYLIGLIRPTPSNNNNPLFLIPLRKYSTVQCKIKRCYVYNRFRMDIRYPTFSSFPNIKQSFIETTGNSLFTVQS